VDKSGIAEGDPFIDQRVIIDSQETKAEAGCISSPAAQSVQDHIRQGLCMAIAQSYER
jgi:hypothetical protein